MLKLTVYNLEESDYQLYTDAGFNRSILLGRKRVRFEDEQGNVGISYVLETDIEKTGLPYLAENTEMEFNRVTKEWIPTISWDAYMNDLKRNPPKTVDVQFVETMTGEDTEIWKRLDGKGYLMRQLCREPFARWLTCDRKQGGWLDGNNLRPNITLRNGDQTETVLYNDWNGTAAYSETFNPNFRKETGT